MALPPAGAAEILFNNTIKNEFAKVCRPSFNTRTSMTTPPLPPLDSSPFIEETAEINGDKPRPQSVTLAVGLAWAVVAIDLLYRLYFYMNYPQMSARTNSPAQMWWSLYGWIIIGATFLAGLGAWVRNGLARLGLTVVLGVSIAVHLWMLSRTVITLVINPQILLSLDSVFFKNFVVYGVVHFLLKIIALVLISMPSARSWFDRSAR
ncbi:MAG: hypothetical protein WCP67_06090 [Verrucomicrobiota bacterium]